MIDFFVFTMEVIVYNKPIDKLYTSLKDINGNEIVFNGNPIFDCEPKVKDSDDIFTLTLSIKDGSLFNGDDLLIIDEQIVLDLIDEVIEFRKNHAKYFALHDNGIITKVEYKQEYYSNDRYTMEICNILLNNTENIITSKEFLEKVDQRSPIQCTFKHVNQLINCGNVTDKDLEKIQWGMNYTNNLYVVMVCYKVCIVTYGESPIDISHNSVGYTIDEFCAILDEIKYFNSFGKDSNPTMSDCIQYYKEKAYKNKTTKSAKKIS